MRPQEKSSASQNSTTRFVRDCCTRNAPKYFLLGLDVAIGLMYDLRVQSVALMQTDTDDGDGRTVGPSYEYVDIAGAM